MLADQRASRRVEQGILCDLFPMIIAICIDAEWDIWAPFSFPDIATKVLAAEWYSCLCRHSILMLWNDCPRWQFAIRSCPGLRVLMYLSAAVSVTWKLVGRLTTGHLISSALEYEREQVVLIEMDHRH